MIFSHENVLISNLGDVLGALEFLQRIPNFWTITLS
jgi:hypothetical protein